MFWEEWWIVIGAAALVVFFIGFEILFPAPKTGLTEKTDFPEDHQESHPRAKHAA